MPLSFEAEEKLTEFHAAAGDFVLFGIFLNPVTGEMGTYSSHTATARCRSGVSAKGR